MPKIEDLEKYLSQHFAKPQASERWAMYRLINPVVDYANLELGLEPYFEFNQTSRHRTSQSVDIALLNNETPIVLVEAKRADKNISSDQINKYLANEMRGIVSNGFNWILCSQGKSKKLVFWDVAENKCIRESIIEIVNFIKTGETNGSDWSVSSSYMKALVKPYKPNKKTKAVRKSYPITVAESIKHCITLINEHSKATEIEKEFLKSLVSAINKSYQCIPSHCQIKFRESRVSFFNTKILQKSKRVARIELGRKQPDILVLTKIVERNPHISDIETSEPADKGGHMRRFRLSDIKKSIIFGKNLGKFIFSLENIN